MQLENNSNERPRVLVEVGAPVGRGTNNEAEYHALIALMRHALRLGFWNLSVTSDSLLVVNQYHGTWKTKGRLIRLRDEARNLGRLFNSFALKHTLREGNTAADALSHQLVFNEPSLPLPKVDLNRSRKPRLLVDWQAAAIRIWSLRYHPGSGTLSRIFGIEKPAIEAIAAGKSYRLADFSGYAEWMYSITTPGFEAYQDYEQGGLPERPQLDIAAPVAAEIDPSDPRYQVYTMLREYKSSLLPE